MNARRHLINAEGEFKSYAAELKDILHERNQSLLAGVALGFICLAGFTFHEEEKDILNAVAQPFTNIAEAQDIEINEDYYARFVTLSSGLFSSIYTLSAGVFQLQARSRVQTMKSVAQYGAASAKIGEVPQPEWVQQYCPKTTTSDL